MDLSAAVERALEEMEWGEVVTTLKDAVHELLSGTTNLPSPPPPTPTPVSAGPDPNTQPQPAESQDGGYGDWIPVQGQYLPYLWPVDNMPSTAGVSHPAAAAAPPQTAAAFSHPAAAAAVLPQMAAAFSHPAAAATALPQTAAAFSHPAAPPLPYLPYLWPVDNMPSTADVSHPAAAALPQTAAAFSHPAVVAALPQTAAACSHPAAAALPQTAAACSHPAAAALPQTAVALSHPVAALPQTAAAFSQPAVVAALPQTAAAFSHPAAALPQTAVAFSHPAAALPQTAVAFSHPVAALPQTAVAFSHPVAALPQTAVAFSHPVAALPQTAAAFSHPAPPPLPYLPYLWPVDNMPSTADVSHPAAAALPQTAAAFSQPDVVAALPQTAAALSHPAPPPLPFPNGPVVQLAEGQSLRLVGVLNGELLYEVVAEDAAPPVYTAPPQDTANSKKRKRDSQLDEDRPHIKKPPNAFMLFLKEQRANVQAEGWKGSAAVNTILGERWRSLTKEQQAKYFSQAEKERLLHSQQHPEWSTQDNYGKKRQRQRPKASRLESVKAAWSPPTGGMLEERCHPVTVKLCRPTAQPPQPSSPCTDIFSFDVNHILENGFYL